MAVWLMTVSTAFACTYFMGRFEVHHVVNGSRDGDYVRAWGCDDGNSATTPGGYNTLESNGASGISVTRGDEVDLVTASTGTTSSTPAKPGGTPCFDVNGTATAVPASITLPVASYDVYLQSIGYGSYQDQYGANATVTPGFPPCTQWARLQSDPVPGGIGDGPGLGQTHSAEYHKLGVVHVDSTGAIDSSYLADGTTSTTTLGRYTIPSDADMVANVGTQEAAICIQDRATTTAQHGNQVPVALL